MPPMASVPADSPTNAVIAGPIAHLLEANFTILNKVRSLQSHCLAGVV